MRRVYDDGWAAAIDPLYENPELWERLIGGDCARVVVLGPSVGRSMLELYFPQTLGWPRPTGGSLKERSGRKRRRGNMAL